MALQLERITLGEDMKTVKVDETTHQKLSILAAELAAKKSDLANAIISVTIEQKNTETLNAIKLYMELNPVK